MNPEEFQNSPSGHLVPTIGKAWAFIPKSLPPELDVREFADSLAEAALRLGELRGIGSTIPNPFLLVRPLQRKEAVASSAIEGTVTSLEQLFLFESGGRRDGRRSEAREVANYARALEHGIGRLQEIPMCLRLISELHEILLRGVQGYRGGRVRPGEFRADQNWIGAPEESIDAARFVPPPPDEMKRALSEFEKFVHTTDDSEIHFLVHLALIHYQFETIHPFPDGNGRVGRLLIPLIMAERGFLDQPLLYLSPYLERHRRAYYDHMLDVSKSGAWGAWVRFFLRAVTEQAADTIERVKDIQQLKSTYHERLQTVRTTALTLKLLDTVFEHLYITAPIATTILGVTDPSARQTISRLINAGILMEVPFSSHPKVYFAPEILTIISRPAVGA